MWLHWSGFHGMCNVYSIWKAYEMSFLWFWFYFQVSCYILDHYRLWLYIEYCQTSNVSHTLVGNNFVDNSDLVGALPVSIEPSTSSLLT